MNPQRIQDYLAGKLDAQEALDVQLFLADHMDDPEVNLFAFQFLKLILRGCFHPRRFPGWPELSA